MSAISRKKNRGKEGDKNQCPTNHRAVTHFGEGAAIGALSDRQSIDIRALLIITDI